MLGRALEFVAHCWAGERAETWFLDLCVTGQEVRGRGFGRELVQWGVNRARQERVCASLIAAEGTEGFYRRCGFGEPVGWVGEGKGNPMKDVPGGAIMFAGVVNEKSSEGEG